jgi:PiT family inorganic phosphate transporter
VDFLYETNTIYIILAATFGIFMAWGIGANDVANAMAPSVGSKALTLKQAVVLAAIFEFAGAYLAGGEVTKTIRKGIVETEAFAGNPDLLIWGMLASLLAAGTWLVIASTKGWPVSTTHSIVGAVVGFAAVGIGMDAVSWSKVGTIAMSWVISPILAGGIAFMVFISIQKLILNTHDPLKNAIKYGPYYLFVAMFIISLVTLKKGLKHIGLDLSTAESFLIAIFIGAAIALVGAYLVRKVEPDTQNQSSSFGNVEKIFGVMMIFTAASMAFAHGSNDVANAVGPMAAVINIAQTGNIAASSSMPAWVLLIGGIGIVIGLATYGYKVIATVGNKITELTPTRGFSANLAAGITIVLASFTGIPISTTHTLVGAVLGVGLARGIASIDLRVVGNIFMSWIITLPVGAVLSIMFFFMLKGMFS